MNFLRKISLTIFIKINQYGNHSQQNISKARMTALSHTLQPH